MRFDIHEQVFDDHGEYLEKKGMRYQERLVALFERSPEGQALLDKGVLLHWADAMIDFGFGYLGVSPPDMSPRDLQEILFELIPRQVCAAPEEAAVVIQELRAFWAFLQREFGLQNAAACFNVLDDRAARKLERAMGDPANFGLAKSFVMMGEAFGFDMATEEGSREWTDTYNAALIAGTGLRVPFPGEKSRSAQKARQKIKRHMQEASRKRNRPKKRKG